ncbi:MAG: zinc ribbon domain-containing protein [Gemmatimonadetes bacterium]|nr:zinc ribbon domain-containing protein [Gemmatimonadota bacterium]
MAFRPQSPRLEFWGIAEEAGRILVAVNLAYTSQDCSQCGHRRRKTLAQRIHHCP